MKHSKVIRPFLLTFHFVLFSFFFLFPVVQTYAQPDGKGLFQSNCAQCHSVGKGTVVGPDLKDISKKRQEPWLLKWIKNSQALVKSGDATAVELFKQYNVEMPAQNLSDEEVKAVLAFIKTESEKAPVAATGSPAGAAGSGEPAGNTDYTGWLWLAITLLAVLAYVLSGVKKTLHKLVRAKENMPEPAPKTFSRSSKDWIRENKKLIAVIILLLFVWGSVKGWYALAGIGISQGYEPPQPIAFSHKIHAGDNGISCVYCHSGAEKSKTAGIPTANVCMNCHKGIRQGTLTGTTEIEKIYKALDYNPETQKYGNNTKPIVWTRVHTLPDFTYFNHSQHVKVAGVECQTCHGPVQEMTVAKQFAPLTMGWCVECHRTTEVKMAGNHYYDAYHEKLLGKLGKDAKITVDKIGGLECSKCHY